MKLEIGMYIRTYEGISKIVNIINNVLGGTLIVTDNKLGNVHRLDDIGYVIDLKDKEFIETHIKESLIDLIQEGDYVNGFKVGYIDNLTGCMRQFNYDYENPNEDVGHWEEEIESVVTKEQFERMSYEV